MTTNRDGFPYADPASPGNFAHKPEPTEDLGVVALRNAVLAAWRNYEVKGRHHLADVTVEAVLEHLADRVRPVPHHGSGP